MSKNEQTHLKNLAQCAVYIEWNMKRGINWKLYFHFWLYADFIFMVLFQAK